jgi:mRNA interferase HigB
MSCVHVISFKRLREFYQFHRDAEWPLRRWFLMASKATWRTIADVRRGFPHADPVLVKSGRAVTVFNVSGNKYRLITAIHYDRQRIYVLRIMAHRQYDKNNWKDEL